MRIVIKSTQGKIYYDGPGFDELYYKFIEINCGALLRLDLHDMIDYFQNTEFDALELHKHDLIYRVVRLKCD